LDIRRFQAETGSNSVTYAANQSGLHRYLPEGLRNPRGQGPFAGTALGRSNQTRFVLGLSLEPTPFVASYVGESAASVDGQRAVVCLTSRAPGANSKTLMIV
jgi:hypothetical protein